MKLRFNFGYLHIAMVWEEGLRPYYQLDNSDFYTYLDNTTEYLGILPKTHKKSKQGTRFISAGQVTNLINTINSTRKQL